MLCSQCSIICKLTSTVTQACHQGPPFHSSLARYFESGVCSVYLWDLDHGFAGVILIKKAGDTDRIKGCWDSIHVVEVQVCIRV